MNLYVVLKSSVGGTDLFLFLILKVDIEMDGKMLNSHGVDFLDGPLGLDLDEKDLDEEETRRDMAKILKELKQKHPDKEVGNKVKMMYCHCLGLLFLSLISSAGNEMIK